MSIRGFHEAVACVRDMHRVAEEFCRLSGWERREEAALDPVQLGAWGLSSEAVGTQCLLTPLGMSRGGLRLVELSNVGVQEEIRSNPQTWDCGALLDLNIRVEDMAAHQRAFSAARWRGPSDPVSWQFGDKKVTEWLTLGPEGLALALIERLDPPLPPGSVPGGFGHIFNSTQGVRDMERSLDFYHRVLGFNKLLHICQPLVSEPMENVLGIPRNLVCELDVEIAILSPGEEMDGSIELIKLHGLEGRDFSAKARPPNLGMLALRFPVEDIDTLCAQLREAGITLAFEPVTVEISALGSVRLMAVQAPEGAWLEFYQQL